MFPGENKLHVHVHVQIIMCFVGTVYTELFQQKAKLGTVHVLLYLNSPLSNTQ